MLAMFEDWLLEQSEELINESFPALRRLLPLIARRRAAVAHLRSVARASSPSQAATDKDADADVKFHSDGGAVAESDSAQRKQEQASSDSASTNKHENEDSANVMAVPDASVANIDALRVSYFLILFLPILTTF